MAGETPNRYGFAMPTSSPSQCLRAGLLLAFASSILPLPVDAFEATDGMIPPAKEWRPTYAAVPRVPPFEPAMAESGEPLMLTLEQIRTQFAAAGANWPVLRHRHEVFLVADHGWLRRFLDWQRHFHWKFDHRYQPEVFDCDDFSVNMLAFVDLAMLRVGVHAQSALVGRLIVQQRHGWAKARAGGMHEVVLIATTRGLHVVEPQNGTMIALADYPNRTHLRRLILN